MGLHVAKPEHEVVYQELVALVTKHAGHLNPMEILAIASNMVGKLVAMQDQRTTTPAMAMELVAHNIQVGNQQVMREIAATAGSA